MTLTTLIRDLGDDANLIIKSDRWLETERRDCAGEINDLAEKLRSIMVAQNAKRILQQSNMVAVQELTRTDEGDVADIVITIANLPDAIQSLNNPADTNDQVNAAAQILTWGDDGYDVPASAALRK